MYLPRDVKHLTIVCCGMERVIRVTRGLLIVNATDKLAQFLSTYRYITLDYSLAVSGEGPQGHL